MCDEESFHPVFIVDPRIRLQLINKYVEISTNNGEVQGFLVSSDPVSQSVILSVPNSGKHNHKIIPGHVISNIKEKQAPENTGPSEIDISSIEITPEQLELKRNKVIEWLQRNLLKVNLQDEAISVHNGQVLIYPPYEYTDCITDNSIILSRMQHLLKNLPNEKVGKT